jgi:hypothetical protein
MNSTLTPGVNYSIAVSVAVLAEELLNCMFHNIGYYPFYKCVSCYYPKNAFVVSAQGYKSSFLCFHGDGTRL